MAYGLSNGHVTDDITSPQRCCTVAYLSDSLASCWTIFQPVWPRSRYLNVTQVGL